jgi:hypothetical protein
MIAYYQHTDLGRIFAGDSGERGRNRTYNLLIKSQLLCQLSYAPVCGETFQKGKSIIANTTR